ncbi:ABC transporter substrate-binding protein [Pseudoalteromonas denitrificans]|uniref:NitT/TauT family transport system substrate-binding protein n=1 Tax=Pseudoalteromonas denitrificans DSM 6059 TaxID=1123010 RepID=A0A1I1ERV1_9GAMM|nr:ABC transporter substrate-binding protein [Pseudoalteromonas denitrificans]SFB89727.1 NitT/TauT family transport system substrate-binding protein [Pseudoalteromonas denitrificans DSM 6059]
MKSIFLIALAVFLLSCSKITKSPKVKLAINPWPGYEFLYLASEKGFFLQEGLNVELIEAPSLADVQRMYAQGHANAMATTMIEAVTSAGELKKPTSLVLIPDYSNGGDVILSNENITSVRELKGKRVGAEIGSLGMFVLVKALKKNGLSLADVEVINVEQLNALNAININEIEAIVTYPPYSIELLNKTNSLKIFTSAEIPNDVVDTISVDSSILKQDPSWLKKFHKVWERSLNYAKTNQQDAYEIMAQREGISVKEFTEALTGLYILPASEQLKVLSSIQLKKNINEVCQTLMITKSISFDCQILPRYLTMAQ